MSALAGPARSAAAREPIDLVPADGLFCWYGRPAPETSAEGPPTATLATWLNLASRMVGRPLEGEPLLWLRLLEATGKVTRQPYAVGLINARAQPAGAGRQLERLELVAVVQTGTDSEPLRRLIQTIINEQVDAHTASLTVERVGSWTYQRLCDRRLPDWAEVAWGELDDQFVVTLGSGVWPRIARLAGAPSDSAERPISRDDWYSAARRARGPQATIEVFAGLGAVRERLDPLVDGRAAECLDALHLHDAERTYWVLGFEGLDLFCEAHFQRGGEHQKRVYADPSFAGPALRGAVPPGARSAVFDVPLETFLPDLAGALLATRDQKVRRNVRAQWELIQQRNGFDAQRDLLAHLGRRVVVHTYPPHPLRIPLATTILIELDGDAERVRRTIDDFCAGWRDALMRLEAESGRPNLLAAHRDDDGIWYVRVGFVAGPAWTVTDRFVVASWSPVALREYLARVGEAVGRRVPPAP